MATIVNNPNGSNEGGWAGSLLVGVVIVILAILFFVYALPALTGNNDGAQDVNLDVPERVDVNLDGEGAVTPQE